MIEGSLRLTGTSVHSSSGYQTPFDELVRVSPHDLPVLAGTRLSLVGVDNEVSGPVMWAVVSIDIVSVDSRRDEIQRTKKIKSGEELRSVSTASEAG